MVENLKDPRNHMTGKYIERKYHLIQENVQQGDVTIYRILMGNYLVDPFTKSLSTKLFLDHLKSIIIK